MVQAQEISFLGMFDSVDWVAASEKIHVVVMYITFLG